MIDKKDKVHGRSIAVIGGDVSFVNSLERMLFYAGANVHAYLTAQKGLNDILNVRPDALVLENSFTDVSVNDLVDTIRANELINDLPIIIIASSTDIEVYKKLFDNSVQDYIVKNDLEVHLLIEKLGLILKDSNNESESEIFDFSESESHIQNSKAAPHLRLLVVEDDSLLRNLLSIRLQKSNIQFDFCVSGNDAISSIIEYKPTVVILDLMLPGRNGMEILSDIRNNPEIASIPVIIFSNRDDDKDKQKAKELGVDVFLTKVMTDLSELIAHVIELGKPTK